MAMAEPDAWLFSYGTLRQSAVQLATFGCLLESAPDVLCGFTLDMLTITDAAVIATSGSDQHPILRQTGNAADAIDGAALAVTAEQLAAADAYEVADYTRVPVVLKSGRAAFVYVAAA